MKKKFVVVFPLFLISFLIFFSCRKNKSLDVSFVVMADMRNYTGDNIDYFRGACEAVKQLEKIEFIVSPGDIDPPDSVLYTMQKYIRQDIIWYPVVGNHEAETGADIQWLRNYNKDGNSLPNIVNMGPKASIETTYSFDYGNTHFVILNEYCNETCDSCSLGDISEYLYNWLEEDLKKTKMKNIIVFGHEPAYPMPDMENQRYRHWSDCLNQFPDNRDKFVTLLQEYKVIAYIVGHTHNYSIVKINNLWHVDVGHARGYADPGAKSTFIQLDIKGEEIKYKTYRLNFEDGNYEIADQGVFE